ncbi:MAG: hypothetical protein WC238_01240 [Parcubacteria group bacterium]|jgi:uncharacterized repeat protein (TIGR01451 family)
MSLSEIKNKLYSKEEDANLSKHGLSEFDIQESLKKAQADVPVEDAWEEKKKGLESEQKKALKIGAYSVLGIAVLALAIFGFYRYSQSAFSEGGLVTVINGPANASSGKLLTFEINYTNNNRATLQDALLRITYPESFKPGENSNFTSESQTSGVFKLGNIAGKSSGKVILSGNAYSPKGALIYLKTDLIYTPSNFNSQFTAKNQIGINVETSPIDLEILAPTKTSSGDAVDYQVSYTNTGKEDFENIKIRVDYPDTFTFSRSNPLVSEGENIWYLGHLNAGQAGKIVISGKLEGNRDEVKNVKAFVGTDEQGKFVSYSEEQAATTIVASPLEIQQSVNGANRYITKAGDVLRFKIVYKNNGNIDLRDVILNEKIDSPVLDYATLELKKGAFDPNSKVITWKGVDDASLKNLAPGQSGEMEFAIKVKEVIPVATANDKNYVISALAKIDSPDIQTPINSNKIISGNNMDIKLDSKLVLDMKGYFNDTTIPNAGPIPPKVGTPTTYTIHWKVMNVSNDITDAKVTASLPTGVTMTGKIAPDDGKLTYNARDNSMVWDLGKMNAGAGILNAPPEVAFQIQITPAQNQADTLVELVGQATFSAKDAFTDNVVSAMAEKKTTGLIEDPGIGSNYKVVN